MKNTKLYFLAAICVSCAYVFQRALLILSGEISLKDMQAQPQVEGGFLGIDISFSYLGMNLYWPIIISIFIFGYIYSNIKTENENLFFKIEEAIPLKGLLIIILTITYTLHFISIHEFTFHQFMIVWESIEGGLSQQTKKTPLPLQGLAGAVIVAFTALSALIALYSIVHLMNKTKKLSKQNAVTDAPS